MANTAKPFHGAQVLITENTTSGTYEIQIFPSTSSMSGTANVTANFTDAQWAQYKAFLTAILSLNN